MAQEEGTALAKSVVEKDHKLESAQTQTLEQLAAHRWHWTLDESNPDRVSIREYARQISRSYTPIAKMVNGYRVWHFGDLDIEIGLAEAIERANYSVEQEAVIDAIAEAEGVKFNTARLKSEEIREVRTISQERAERRGTSIEEEAPRVAAERVRDRNVSADLREERRQRHTFRYMEIEGHLAAAQQRLSSALKTAQDVGWEDEEIELLADSLGKIRAILNLIDMRIAGETQVDWDDELARLTQEK